MAGRSLRASEEGIQKANIELTSRAWGREDLQDKVQASRQPITKFFSGKPVSRKIFVEICRTLDLNWQEVIVSSSTASLINGEEAKDVELAISQILLKQDDFTSRSLEMFDEIGDHLTGVANQIRQIVRPYQKNNALPISKLVSIWNTLVMQKSLGWPDKRNRRG
jgi:predicted NACHT family NTPase